MDRRLHILLLSGVALAGLAGASASAQEAAAAPETPQVVEPQVERREVQRPEIDTENFEAGAFIGTISIEDFGSSFTYGARIAYHFTEDVFAEATIGTADAGRTSYEDLSGSVDLLTDSERTFTSYDLAVGWNALPGEAFFGGRRAMPSALYLTLGAGSTRFAGDDHFTVTLGAGLSTARDGLDGAASRRPQHRVRQRPARQEQDDAEPAGCLRPDRLLLIEGNEPCASRAFLLP
jgi:outer membrane beta-barrel protein